MNIDTERLESLVLSQIPDEVLKELKIDVKVCVHNSKIEDGEIVVQLPNHGYLTYDPVTYTPTGGGGGGAE